MIHLAFSQEIQAMNFQFQLACASLRVKLYFPSIQAEI